MRIQQINLSWFRGAANLAELDTELRSVVVYGPTGSGKSTFVDAIEYMKEGGRINHLRHGYSGARQELGVRNTHTPPGVSASIELLYEDDDALTILIDPDGRHSTKAKPDTFQAQLPQVLESHQILRQDELAKFVELDVLSTDVIYSLETGTAPLIPPCGRRRL